MKRVLVVEDDVDLRRAVARNLEDHGFHVTLAEAMHEAMPLLDRAEFDVLVTDLRLQDESGLELIREATERSPRTRAVLMSAFATARDHETATNLGAIRVLCKPFSRADLLSAVRHAVESETGVRGSIHGLSVVDLLQMYHFARRSLVILLGGPTSGEIHVREGQIVHAVRGETVGEDALRSLLQAEGVSVRTSGQVEGVDQTIDKPFDSLVLDSLRSLDEASRDDADDWIERLTFSPPALLESTTQTNHTSAVLPTTGTASNKEVTMGKIDDACREVVGNVDGAVACGVVDLDTGMLLGIHNSAGYTQTLNEVVAAATMDLFRGPNVGRVEQMVRAHRGVEEDGSHYFQEVHITSAHNYHFAKVIKGGKAVMMLVTKKTTNIGMGWAQLKSVIPQVEPHVP